MEMPHIPNLADLFIQTSS